MVLRRSLLSEESDVVILIKINCRKIVVCSNKLICILLAQEKVPLTTAPYSSTQPGAMTGDYQQNNYVA